MKLNKKGLSIIELIVSIALISVIMLFMYKLLADISFERENDYIANSNQEQRIEIIDNIEKYLDGIKTSINSYTFSDNNFIINSKSIVTAENHTLILTDLSGNIKNRWTIKGGMLGSVSCESSTYTDSTLVTCQIPIYTSNVDNHEDNNNTLDDIFFSVMYKQE